ncbi:MAG: hypothetical protein V3W44_10265 [Dehalococcoidales bacterium]
MNNTAPNTVADSTLPLLVTLTMARKQARWQWRNCADEHKHRWTLVIDRLDDRIAVGERLLASRLELNTFRVKREVIE